MVHAWCYARFRDTGHGARFKRKLRECGITSIYHDLGNVASAQRVGQTLHLALRALRVRSAAAQPAAQAGELSPLQQTTLRRAVPADDLGGRGACAPPGRRSTGRVPLAKGEATFVRANRASRGEDGDVRDSVTRTARGRIESDSMGKIEVPADKYYGAQAARSLVHFDIGDGEWPRDVMPRQVIKAMARAQEGRRAGQSRSRQARRRKGSADRARPPTRSSTESSTRTFRCGCGKPGPARRRT